MCYFEQTRWQCGFWRWSQFRQQCTKEYRTGETCGLKLVYSVYDEPDKCKLCYDMDKKQRRMDKMKRDIARWQHDTNRTATLSRTLEELREVTGQVTEMSQQHFMRVHGPAY